MAEVRIQRIVKEFGPVRAVNDVSLTIHDKEFLVLLGPSGCGKTTLLRMIAGLEEPTAGEIFIDDKLVNFTAPKDRDIAMVFQNYALYPHMDVTSNIALGLKLHNTPKQIITARLNEAADWLQLTPLLKRYPRQLSGGQQQRVALGRSVVREPKVFLMDEPLSNLDARLRVNMRTELIKLHRQLGATIVYVTHDQSEAMTMATRVAIMRNGVIQQLAPPLEVYRHPANKYVATFMGNPEMNFIGSPLTITMVTGNWLAIPSTCRSLPNMAHGWLRTLGTTSGSVCGRRRFRSPRLPRTGTAFRRWSTSSRRWGRTPWSTRWSTVRASWPMSLPTSSPPRAKTSS
jgi:multiple sugar transport system ATP-binding protein